VIVEYTEGARSRSIVANACVVTVPLGVLQARKICFSPALPRTFQRAVDSSAMGLLNKSCLFFASQADCFWDLSKTLIHCISATSADTTFLPSDGSLGDPFGTSHPRGYCPWILNMVKVAAIPAIILYTGTEFSLAWERHSDDELTQHFLALLTRLFPVSGPVPQPVRAVHTRWSQDPFSLGSYSHRRVGFDDKRGFTDLAGPFWGGRLAFAGEHTSADSFAMVHGALAEGERAAGVVLGAA